MQPEKNAPLAVIVEDNTLLSSMFSRALQDINYQTHIIEDGRSAIEWLSSNIPDLLLLDLHLPYVSGRDVLKMFVDDPGWEGTYIMMVTADARLGETLRGQVDFFLNKPVDLALLQQMAQRLQGSNKQEVMLNRNY